MDRIVTKQTRSN